MSEFILTKLNNNTEPLFTCPNCGGQTAHEVCELIEPGPANHSDKIQTRFIKCICKTCKGESYLLEKFQIREIDTTKEEVPSDDNLCMSQVPSKQQMRPAFATGITVSGIHVVSCIVSQRFVKPDIAMNVPPVNKDLNQRSKDLYNEAASIMNKSPRAAAALMRLALEVMLEENFSLTSGTINKRLGELYSDGIPDEIDTALHFVRIAGNAADHPDPGLISLDGKDGTRTVMTLFEVLNYIVEDQISRKKKLSGLAKFFTSDEQKGIDNLHAKNQPSQD